MAATEELIDQLGGGGPVGLAIAAVVLAPAVFPPVRRSLRGLAKGAIVQYLRVTAPRAPAALEPEEAPAAVPELERPRRRTRAMASGDGGAASAAASPPAAAPRSRRARPTPAAAEPTFAPPPETRAPASRAAAPVAAAVPAQTEAPSGGSRATAPGATDGLVNLNTATRGQLTRLPRVGAQTADRIIEFREQQGPIRNLRQLRQADVISVAAAKQIRDLVRF